MLNVVLTLARTLPSTQSMPDPLAVYVLTGGSVPITGSVSIRDEGLMGIRYKVGGRVVTVHGE
jgi:hypothetical protein